jgi:hypothetical protein
MSLLLLLKTFIETFAKIQKRFFWQGGSYVRKYYVIKWKHICKSKKKGDLGIKGMEKMNLSLLCKWWWKVESSKGLC